MALYKKLWSPCMLKRNITGAVIKGRMHKTQNTQNTIHVLSMYLNPIYCDNRLLIRVAIGLLWHPRLVDHPYSVMRGRRTD